MARTATDMATDARGIAAKQIDTAAMSLPLNQLPDDIDALKRLVLAKDDEVVLARAELTAAKNGLLVTQLTIEHLKAQLAKLRREKFGASSERIEREIAQLELKLEDAQTAQAEAGAPAAQTAEPDPELTSQDAPTPEAAAPEKKKRRTLPPELPRRDVVHAPAEVCKACGGHELRAVGESVTEILEYIPGRFEVVRHVRPACSCRKCEAMVQAPMPDLPIPRGMAGPSFLAHIAIAKFCDHLPLYRQAEIYARAGLDVDRGLLADWLGHIAWLLKPLAELIGAHVMAGRVIHADDTPVDVLAPGNGKTKTGRQWVYLHSSVEMVRGVLRRVAHAQDMDFQGGVIDSIKHDEGIAYDRQLTNAGHLALPGAVGKIGKAIDRLLDGSYDAVGGGRVVRSDVIENRVELRDGGRTKADLHRPCCANMAATSSSVANSPRRAAASSASSSARSSAVSLVDGMARERARSSNSTANRSC